MRIAMASVLLTVAVAGCGSADTEREAVSPLAHAASATQAASSARMTFQTVGEIAGQTVKGTGSGLVRFKPPKAQLTFKMSAAGQAFALDEVLDGTTLYMKLPKEAAAGIPDGKTWLKLDLNKASGGAFSGMLGQSQDPASQLKLLSELAGAKAVGKETIDGAATTHYHGEVDYRRLAKSGPPELRKAAKLAVKVMDDARVPVDAWIDGQNRVRRQKLEVIVKPSPNAAAQKQTVTIGYSDFGADTSGIQAPDASDTYDATDEAAAQLNIK
jgi:LppX_LprAFG lipoprotein